jgi:hypothetical protein
MILKRTVNDGVIKGFYDSSNILVSEYDQKENNLTIVFKGGGTYKYNNVSVKDFTRFEMADSQGIVLNKHIKPIYTVDKLDRIDTKNIVETLSILDKEALQAFGEVVKSKCSDVMAEVDSKLEISDKRIGELRDALTLYESKRK